VEYAIVYCKANTDMLYCKYKKGTTAHKVVDLMRKVEIPPLAQSKFWGGFSM
jgi:hypothetical protein